MDNTLHLDDNNIDKNATASIQRTGRQVRQSQNIIISSVVIFISTIIITIASTLICCNHHHHHDGARAAAIFFFVEGYNNNSIIPPFSSSFVPRKLKQYGVSMLRPQSKHVSFVWMRPGASASPSSSSSCLQMAGGSSSASRRSRRKNKGGISKNDSNDLLKTRSKKGFGTSTSSSPALKDKKTREGAGVSSSSSPQEPAPKTTTMHKQKGMAGGYTKSEQSRLIESLASKASDTCIGRAVREAKLEKRKRREEKQKNNDNDNEDDEDDPFWDLMPSLIQSKFPNANDDKLRRVAGFIRHAMDPTSSNVIDQDVLTTSAKDDNNHKNDPDSAVHRPIHDIHSYMPGLGSTTPFYDPDDVSLCNTLSDNYDIITSEYDALVEYFEQHNINRFQSVTSMNYDSGWTTLIMFYNGHRIPDFPYHLCPITTSILETVPLAGRIAGFNKQLPSTGIPAHTDGNNMWLTCQMGIHVPSTTKQEYDKAWIRVGSEKRYWKPGQCLLYDTTYIHETMNEHEQDERVVLHVDFFNTLSMTDIEIDIMKYIYHLREQFMIAEGNDDKVGKHIL